MNTYFVLYDQRQQVQRVARAATMAEAQRYLDAGFVPVSEREYQRAAALVSNAPLEELTTLTAAAAVLQRIQQQERQIATLPEVDPRALAQLQERITAEYQRISTAFTDGQVTVEQWYRQMVDLSNRANLAAAALAAGGIDQLSRADVAAVERANETQAQYLSRFRREVPTLSALAIIARAALYAGVIQGVFWAVAARAMGLPPLPAMPAVLTSCHTNCKCTWDIRPLAGNGNWDCYWTLAAAEHCPECSQRARVFNPLQIREGIIQPFNPIGIYTR